MIGARRSLVFVSCIATVLLGGCQSYETGMLTLCDAPDHCTECADAPPDQKSELMAKYIEAAVRNEDVETVFHKLGGMPLRERIALLRAEAKKAGIAGCRLADVYEADASEAEADL